MSHYVRALRSFNAGNPIHIGVRQFLDYLRKRKSTHDRHLSCTGDVDVALASDLREALRVTRDIARLLFVHKRAAMTEAVLDGVAGNPSIANVEIRVDPRVAFPSDSLCRMLASEHAHVSELTFTFEFIGGVLPGWFAVPSAVLEPLAHARHLTVLHIGIVGSHGIRDDISTWQQIAACPSLRVLDVHGHDDQCDGLSDIKYGMAAFDVPAPTRLALLRVYGVRAAHVAGLIRNSPDLEYLDVEHEKLCDGFFELVAPYMPSVREIVWPSMRTSDLSIPSTLVSRMRRLRFDSPESMADQRAAARMIDDAETLRGLQFECIGADSDKPIIDAVLRRTSLRHLTVNVDNLTNNDVVTMITGLVKNCTQLTSIRVTGSSFMRPVINMTDAFVDTIVGSATLQSIDFGSVWSRSYYKTLKARIVAAPSCGIAEVRLGDEGFVVLARVTAHARQRTAMDALRRCWVRAQRDGDMRAPLSLLPHELLDHVENVMRNPTMPSAIAEWKGDDRLTWCNTPSLCEPKPRVKRVRRAREGVRCPDVDQ